VGWSSTVRAVGGALGLWQEHAVPLGCTLGRSVFRETKRSAQICNLGRTARPLLPATIARIGPLFPQLDLSTVSVRERCRLPSNRFHTTGSIYAMTFGSTIYFRDRLDEHDPGQLVHLIHELVHVDQVRRYGGEPAFACEYGRGYIDGGGELPAYIDHPTAYHRNPLEAEAYTFEALFRDARGRVDPMRLPEFRAAPCG
jgi:Domain of unknown function (DUF4157)